MANPCQFYHFLILGCVAAIVNAADAGDAMRLTRSTCSSPSLSSWRVYPSRPVALSIRRVCYCTAQHVRHLPLLCLHLIHCPLPELCELHQLTQVNRWRESAHREGVGGWEDVGRVLTLPCSALSLSICLQPSAAR